jgi:hypothetical protein
LKMLNTAAATDESRAHDRPWVNLCSRLPKYVPTSSLLAKMDRCTNTSVKTVLDLCVKSRPLFAKAVACEIENYLDRSPDQCFQDIIEFIDELRDQLVHVLRTKRRTSDPDGCYGYVMAMLLAGGALFSGDMDQMRLFGNLTNTNWAYLVDDPEILKMIMVSTTKAKQARLDRYSHAKGDDRFTRLSIRIDKPSSLHLWCSVGFTGSHNDLFFLSAGERIMFPCTSFLPDPNEDFLLHLMLTGSRKQPGLYVKGSRKLFERISMAKLIESVFANTPKCPSSVYNIAPSYDYHEALVCSAFFAACNSGSLRGCSLEELVGRFVSELIKPRETNYSALTLDDKVPLKGEFVAHFAFPFDTELPQEVYETLNALQLSRSTNEQSVDAATYKPDGSGTIHYQVLVEVESTASVECVQARIREALARKDSNPKVSFIVVKNFGFKDLEFKQEKLKVRYRSKKGEKGENSDARVFFVEINGSKKLVLRAIDGKPYEEVSERVILVISMY